MDINDIKEKAQELNGKAVSGVIDAEDRFEAKRARLDPLKKFFKRLGLFFELIKDWWSGHYREVPWSKITMIAFAILYFLNPYDAILDFIPGIGYVDDATVVSLVLMACAEDFRKYIDWKRLEDGYF
jgi:uncharacterized membrane protein YkvA (DUF1232 family)